MRATLLGAGLLVLLLLLGVGVVRESGGGSGFVAGWLGPREPAEPSGAAPAAVPREPGSAASPHDDPPASGAVAKPAGTPLLISAGALSVLDADGPEPMVRYVDAGGSIRMVRGLVRVPPEHRADAVVLRRGHVNLVEVPAPTALAFRDWQPAPNPNRSEVVLFGAPWCGACARAKRHLDSRGVRYEERDIDADDSAREEVVRIVGHVAIPLLDVDGRYVSGFRPDVYDRALGGG